MRRIRIVFALALLAACARSVEVSTPAPTYPVEVRSTLREDALVSYDDGAGARLLGTVPAGRTERFLIAAPRAMDVRILARSTDGARSWGPIAVVLQAGVTQSVTLR